MQETIEYFEQKIRDLESNIEIWEDENKRLDKDGVVVWLNDIHIENSKKEIQYIKEAITALELAV